MSGQSVNLTTHFLGRLSGKPVLRIGVERFRILGGGGGGCKGGPNSQQAHDVVMMSMRHNDIDVMCPLGF